jgi:copper chaperone CopZ
MWKNRYITKLTDKDNLIGVNHMKRILSITLGLLALTALLVPAGSFAGEGCTGMKTNAGQASAKGPCTAGASASCAATCAAKLGMTPEECQKLCAGGEYTMVNMSIKGMTCTGCESTISTSLSQLPGVVKVGKVSWQEGTAFVLVDNKKVQNEAIVKAVSDKGYQAEIIPAVSVTPIGSTTAVGAQPACGAAAAAGCAKKCSKPCGSSTTTTEKTEKTEKTETKTGGGL